jgi:hypothetical protein
MTSSDAELRDAYRRTEYRVDEDGFAFVLLVDRHSSALLACHVACGVDCSTFITAWNPRSLPAAQDINEAAMTRLEGAVQAQGLRALHGVGVDPRGDWPGEPSLLVLGLGEAAGVELARAFDQHAIVCAGEDAIPRLVMCR